MVLLTRNPTEMLSRRKSATSKRVCRAKEHCHKWTRKYYTWLSTILPKIHSRYSVVVVVFFFCRCRFCGSNGSRYHGNAGKRAEHTFILKAIDSYPIETFCTGINCQNPKGRCSFREWLDKLAVNLCFHQVPLDGSISFIASSELITCF